MTVPQQPRQLRPYAMLLSALSWGRFCGDPVHNEVRPDVGAAIYSSVSPEEGHRLILICRVYVSVFGIPCSHHP